MTHVDEGLKQTIDMVSVTTVFGTLMGILPSIAADRLWPDPKNLVRSELLLDFLVCVPSLDSTQGEADGRSI